VREPLEVIAGFLRSIGLNVRFAPLASPAGLPGIAAECGELIVEADRLVSPGDLLHEAGHLAVMSPPRRRAARGRFDASQAEEMAAMAWSYAAALHLGLDPALVFHEYGYGEGGGGWVVEAFIRGGTPGVPGLCWLGLTSHAIGGTVVPDAVYPTMIGWLNEIENELR
jgi:hypothetical protein